MHNSPNRFPALKDFGLWLRIWTEERVELLCLENLSFVSPFLVHYFSYVSSNSMIRNRNRTGDMLYPWLTPTLKGMEVSIFPIISLTTLFLYTILFIKNIMGGAPYPARMPIRSLWLEVLKDFTRSENSTQLGNLWLFRRCSKVFKVNLPHLNPTPGVDPHWYLTPCAFMILNTRPYRIIINTFAPMPIRVTPRHFLVSDKSPLFCTGTIWTSYYS